LHESHRIFSNGAKHCETPIKFSLSRLIGSSRSRQQQQETSADDIVVDGIGAENYFVLAAAVDTFYQFRTKIFANGVTSSPLFHHCG
jgi:hypothetical protein